MLLADVNVFVYAHRIESPRHEEHRDWLQSVLAGPEPFGISELVLSAFVRLVTFHRIFADPTPPHEAIGFCRAVLAAPSAVVVRPGNRHWALFADLVTTVPARGNVVPDAYHAALALEHNCTWISHDGGFARFPALRWRRPLEG